MRKCFFLFVFACSLLSGAGVSYGQDVVATTSVLSSVIRDIAQEKLGVTEIVPPGTCPGHFDLKISHLTLIKKSGVLFAHGFEGYLEKIGSSVGAGSFDLFTVAVEGNWLLPEAQKQAYDKITKHLSVKFPEHGGFFAKRRKSVDKELGKTEEKIKKLVYENDITGLPVICNVHIKGLLQYMGLEVVGTYGRKEELTSAMIRDLIVLAEKENVRLVVDNMQTGADTGKVIADQLNIRHIAVSNFPGWLPETETLRETLYENIKRIIGVYNEQNKAG